jgi:hypothetical protein
MDRHTSVAVMAGATSLRLATTQRPLLFARFVCDNDGTQILGADAVVIGWFAGEGATDSLGVASDAAGEAAVAPRNGTSRRSLARRRRSPAGTSATLGRSPVAT